MVRIVSRQSHNWTKCLLCGAFLPSLERLHEHIAQRHPPQYGAGEAPEPVIRENDPLFQNFAHPERVEALYNSSLAYILSPHNFKNANIHIYNFPVAGVVTDDDIDQQMREIYFNENTQHAYKIDVTAGVILHETSKNVYRYFAPASNAYILDSPVLIESVQTLESSIDVLKRMDLDYMIRHFRPNSRYQVVMICNLEWHAYMLDFPLTSIDIEFPSFLKSKTSIITDYSLYEKNYAKCCFFIAYAQHKTNNEGRDVRRVKLQVKESLCKWSEFCERNGIRGYGRSTTIPSKFPGLRWNLIDQFEDCYEINVVIMEMKSKNVVVSRRRSEKKYIDTLFLNRWKDHVSYVSNINALAAKHLCTHCSKMFDHHNTYVRHERSCSRQTRFLFEGGAYKYHTTIFEQLEQLGVSTDEGEIKHNEFFTCFDMEAMLERTEEVTASGKTRFVALHRPISASLAANVGLYVNPHCIVDRDEDSLIESMMDHLYLMRKAIIEKTELRWGKYLLDLENKMQDRWECVLSEFDGLNTRPVSPGGGEKSEGEYWQALAEYAQQRRNCVSRDQLFVQYKKLYSQMYRYIYQVVVLSFNGSRYDLPLINRALINYFIINKEVAIDDEEEEAFDREVEIENMFSSGGDDDVDDEGLGFDPYDDQVPTMDEVMKKMKLKQAGKIHVTKRNSSYVTIQNNHFSFLDICQYLPPGTNLRRFFKAYSTSGSKLFFPYEYVTDFEKLEGPIPPYPSEAWESSLRGGVDMLSEEYDEYIASGGDANSQNRPFTGQENYNMMAEMWREKNVQTLEQWLKIYNNADVGPFVNAVENMQREYYNQNLDIFRIAVSIPGVARIKMMKYAQQQNVLFPLVHRLDEDLFWLFKAQLCGGASIIFNRYVEVDKTEVTPGSGVKTKAIQGWDATALYLGTMAQPQMAFMYVRRFSPDFEPHFRPQYYAMFYWMEYLKKEKNWRVRNKHNAGRDFRFGPYLADGIAIDANGDKYILEYLGCWVHGHRCMQRAVEPDALRKWEKKKDYLENVAGFKLHFIWECQWNELCKNEYPQYGEKVRLTKPKFFRKHPHATTEGELLNAVVNDEIFGFLLIDISVPEDRPDVKERVMKFPCLFANHDLEESELCDEIKEFMETRGMKYGKSRRFLLSGLHAREFLVNTALLKFYIKMGMRVDKIHQVVEYVETHCFRNFVDEVTYYRKQAQLDPDKAVIGAVYKLIGNSSYGSQVKMFFLLFFFFLFLM